MRATQPEAMPGITARVAATTEQPGRMRLVARREPFCDPSTIPRTHLRRRHVAVLVSFFGAVLLPVCLAAILIFAAMPGRHSAQATFVPPGPEVIAAADTVTAFLRRPDVTREIVASIGPPAPAHQDRLRVVFPPFIAERVFQDRSVQIGHDRGRGHVTVRVRAGSAEDARAVLAVVTATADRFMAHRQRAEDERQFAEAEQVLRALDMDRQDMPTPQAAVERLAASAARDIALLRLRTEVEPLRFVPGPSMQDPARGRTLAVIALWCGLFWAAAVLVTYAIRDIR